jgi:hypothetical protein
VSDEEAPKELLSRIGSSLQLSGISNSIEHQYSIEHIEHGACGPRGGGADQRSGGAVAPEAGRTNAPAASYWGNREAWGAEELLG